MSKLAEIEPFEINICGFDVDVNGALGLISVTHDGAITWDQLQQIKNTIWGVDAVAIEVFPPENMVINNVSMRHLWRLGSGDWWPDLLGRDVSAQTSNLRTRFDAAWSERPV